jgi:hypothetical protein
MDLMRMMSVLAVIVALEAIPVHAQQWDTSKLQKNKQTTITGSSSGMKFGYEASTSSMNVQQEMAPAPAAQWDTSKLQKNIQSNVTGRYGTPDFQYAPPAVPVVVQDKVPAKAEINVEKKYGSLYLGEEEASTAKQSGTIKGTTTQSGSTLGYKSRYKWEGK